MQKEVKGSCEYSLVLSFHSMDELFAFAEQMKQQGQSSGVNRIECIDQKVLMKIRIAIERKSLRRRKIKVLSEKESSNDTEHEFV